MYRLLFEKKGRAVWISHLDLMRLFQRAFKRAGMSLTHTQGYNPRPSVSIALPLSVGTESRCELLDFDLENTELTPQQILIRLNEALVEGICVREVYQGGGKIRDIAYLQCGLSLSYDNAPLEGSVEEIRNLFTSDTCLVEKKTKNGLQSQDVLPMIRNIEVWAEDEHICISCKICCQNPSLNPSQLVAAISRYLPHLTPAKVSIQRQEIFDRNDNVFR